ncbi:MAG: DUF5665 domain-containing protein [Alphaproteobacteria bacterium]|nr:DUF5665 domain-containing protein [Alphaproteobacteria bacterium]
MDNKTENKIELEGEVKTSPADALQEEKHSYSRECLERLSKLSDELNRAKIFEYIELVQNPIKLFCLNFLSGLAKGLGLTLGTAIVLTALFKISQHIIALNIPYITQWVSDWISQIMKMLGK